MYTYKAVIVKVIDGDSIRMDIDLGFDIWMRNENVRLNGIDTPESRTRDPDEKVYGMLAKTFVADKLPVGTEIVVKTDIDKSGKFGRFLGEVFMDTYQISLNVLLLEAHLAVPYEGQSKELIKEAHLQNRKLIDAQT